MKEIAQVLKSKRESLSKSISTVSAETRIRENLLLLIEDGEYTQLPSYLHAYGFIKKYAEYLGVDFENEIRPLLDVECTKEMFGIAPEPTFTQAYVEKSSLNLLPIIVIVVIILGVVTYFAKSYVDNLEVEGTVTITENHDKELSTLLNEVPTAPIEPTPESVVEMQPEAPIAEPIIEEPLTQEEPTVQEPIQVVQPKQPERIDILFTGDCWLKFTPDNSTPIEFSGTVGIRKRVSFYNYFSLDIGNAAGIEVKFKDQTLDSFGGEGVVLKNVTYEVKNGKLVRVKR